MSSVFRTESYEFRFPNIKIWVQFSGLKIWGRDLENFFQKIQKIFKIPKKPKIVPKSVQTCFEHVLGQFFRKKICPVFHGWSRLQKNSIDLQIFFQLLTKCYVKRLTEKLYLEKMKTKKFYDNTVISFTKEVVSCECHHRVQFFKEKILIKLLVCSRNYVGSFTHYFISDMECPKKERPTIRRAVSQFLSIRENRLYTFRN